MTHDLQEFCQHKEFYIKELNSKKNAVGNIYENGYMYHIGDMTVSCFKFGGDWNEFLWKCSYYNIKS